MNKINKLKSILIMLFVIFTSIIYSNASDEGYYIKNMDVKVEVNDKREYKIIETIDVYFNENRHGIIRNIPLYSSVENYKINDVIVKGSTYKIFKDSNYQIQIGEKNKPIIGDKRYVIEYTLSHYKDTEKDGDYIYLNVLGTEWDTYIENFTSTVKYPSNFKKLDLNVTSGSYGSKDNKLMTYEVKNNTVYINSKNKIQPQNGVTLNIKFNEGAFINAPTNIKTLILGVFNILIAFILFMTILIMVVSRFKIKNIQSTVEFYPPDNLNSVELGYLYTGSICENTILSLIYCWANKGYLKISLLKKDNFSLTKLKDMDENDNDYEKELFDKIFACGNPKTKVVTAKTLKYRLQSDIKTCKRKAKNKFKTDKNYLKKNKIYQSICLIVFTIIALSSFCDYRGYIAEFILIKYVEILFLILFFHLIQESNIDENKSVFNNLLRNKDMNILIKVFMGISLLLGFLIIVKNGNNLYHEINKNTWFILFGSSWILIIGKLIIPSKNKYEREILTRIKGFKQFIELAEKDKLEMLLEEDPEYFYKVLPYAQVLNITDKWIDKLELISIPESKYYDYGKNASTSIYELNLVFCNIGKDIISVNPSSGASFSRGFVGGGSGGGGGSSW